MRAMFFIASVGIIWFSFSFSSQSSHTSSPGTQAEGNNSAAHTPEYKLAVIDANERIPQSDPRVGEYALLLDSLSKKCRGSSREYIANTCYQVYQLLKKRGIHLSLSSTCRELDDSVPKGAEALDLDFEVVADIYLALRKEQGHR